MALDDLIRDPASHTHPWFGHSALDLPAAPEYATGEVLLAGACRRLVLSAATNEDAQIDLEHILELPRGLVASGSAVPEALWANILSSRGGLRSPPAHGQTRTKILPQLCPLVPQVAWHAGVLGKPRGRWNPGNLIVGTFGAGTSVAGTRSALASIRSHLLVDGNDDFLARFIEVELARLRLGPLPTETAIFDAADMASRLLVAPRRSEPTRPGTPAEQAVADLPHVLALKSRLTRRQWTAMMEGFLRFSLGTHLLWLCRLNQRAWSRALRPDDHSPVPSRDELARECFEDHLSGLPALHLGQSALPLFRAHIEQYVAARFGFSVLAITNPAMPVLGSAAFRVDDFPAMLHQVLTWLRANRESFRHEGNEPAAWARMTLGRVLDGNPKYAAAVKGTFGNNLFEYLRHTLGQVRPIEDEDSEYDQSYLLRKVGRSNNSPSLVEPGPALQMLWAHLCCRWHGGTASLRDLSSYLRNYGIGLPEALASRQAPMRLEQLGLVIDSPDAAGGRMLVDPFPGPAIP